MRRTWIAIIAIALLTLTSAAFVEKQFRSETTSGEEIADRLFKFNETLNNFYGLSTGTREDEHYKKYLAAWEAERYSPRLFRTKAAQLPRVWIDGKRE